MSRPVKGEPAPSSLQISLPNDDRALKPGMPADAYFGAEQAPGAEAGMAAGATALPTGAVAASGTIETTESGRRRARGPRRQRMSRKGAG